MLSLCRFAGELVGPLEEDARDCASNGRRVVRPVPGGHDRRPPAVRRHPHASSTGLHVVPASGIDVGQPSLKAADPGALSASYLAVLVDVLHRAFQFRNDPMRLKSDALGRLVTAMPPHGHWALAAAAIDIGRRTIDAGLYPNQGVHRSHASACDYRWQRADVLPGEVAVAQPAGRSPLSADAAAHGRQESRRGADGTARQGVRWLEVARCAGRDPGCHASDQREVTSK
ncbi:hypothetical protein BLA23254_04466 [Burkholderia lata]|uniref:Uncharacterized protein n=1 Tax=Burkholderia lata (strain ATCC 17760 / DSM 23089 / LMG 22485 / NCIMB 9086 / R18194 / 383) TaxID=482957 RepID=A0A6P2N6I3_BURL3|nr:hypothetical protein BLA23254_04466 [Burkholderia lata]